MRQSTAETQDNDTVRRGQEIYERIIRPELEPGSEGKLLVLNVETGEYEIDADDVAAAKRAKVRFPNAQLFTMRVGRPAAYHIGGAALSRRS